MITTIADAVAPLSGVTLFHYLFVACAMFVLGLVGFLTRRNLIIMFLCTELMFQAAGIALIAFSRFHMNHTGETFVIFVLTVAAAEAALALALVVLLFRRKETLDASAWTSMKG
ncbi:MAG: NADH-quinone oxidoreductase subunit NuoK [Phycisphaerales bacterium]|nr:NADH-quinone oxidoreductase subunit NuoK [Phycisphaerales bacterium]